MPQRDADPETRSTDPAPVEGRRPDVAKANSAAFLLSKLGLWSSRRFAERLAPLGLEPRHAALLREVQANEGVSQQRLADGLGLPPSRIVALVDDLEAFGLVERGRNPDDRRAHALILTDEGAEVAEALARIGREHEEEATAPLSADERQRLVGLLARLAEELQVPLDVHQEMAAPPRGSPPASGKARFTGAPRRQAGRSPRR